MKNRTLATGLLFSVLALIPLSVSAHGFHRLRRISLPSLPSSPATLLTPAQPSHPHYPATPAPVRLPHLPSVPSAVVSSPGTSGGHSSGGGTPAPASPSVSLRAASTSLTVGATTTLSWTSSNASSCQAFGGWLGSKGASGTQTIGPSATTTYALACAGNGGTATSSVTVGVTQLTPRIGHVLISEVLYDADAAHGVNSGNGNNEWVELYNGTGRSVNLSDWSLSDNHATDTLPLGTVLTSGSFLIVTATTSTRALWNLPATAQVVVLGSEVGNGLAAGGDEVRLSDASSTPVDAVSWGSDTDIFSPSVPGVAKGHSIERMNLATDTDSGADWQDNATPSPDAAGDAVL